MRQEEAQPVRGRALNLPSLLVVLWVFRRAKRGTDADRPEIVSTNAKSKAVLERAKQLAGEGCEDERAVLELTALAGNRRRTLRQAEKASRFMGYHHELSRANLTSRLLKAALAREAAPPAPTARDRERIEAVESFNREERTEQWVRLTRLQPALLELDADVHAGRFGEITTRNDDLLRGRAHTEETPDGERRRIVTFSSSDPPFTQEQLQELQKSARGQQELMRQLRLLVGPASPNDDLLLSSQRALDIANAYLLRPPT